MKREIELGDKVKDLITGFEGIAVAKTEFINGCVQFSVAKQLKKGEKFPDLLVGEPCIDSKSLRIVKKKAVNLDEDEEDEEDYEPKRSGGRTTITKRMRGY